MRDRRPTAMVLKMVTCLGLFLCFVAFMVGQKAVVMPKLCQFFSQTMPRSTTYSSRETAVSNSRPHHPMPFLMTTLCTNKDCKKQCHYYQTPMNTCFHGASLFPDDPSWNASSDIFDSPINVTHFQRKFYNATTANQTTTILRQKCQGDSTDGFVLPYHMCIGPFGAPRPWGSFQLLSIAPKLSSA